MEKCQFQNAVVCLSCQTIINRLYIVVASIICFPLSWWRVLVLDQGYFSFHLRLPSRGIILCFWRAFFIFSPQSLKSAANWPPWPLFLPALVCLLEYSLRYFPKRKVHLVIIQSHSYFGPSRSLEHHSLPNSPSLLFFSTLKSPPIPNRSAFSNLVLFPLTSASGKFLLRPNCLALTSHSIWSLPWVT